MNPRSPCHSVSLFSRISQFVWQPMAWRYRDDRDDSLSGHVVDAAERLSRVLTNDPGTGVMRHVDADYDEAIKCAKDLGVKIPMLQ